MENIEQLKADLALAEKTKETPAIKANEVLSKSIDNKIATLKQKIEKAEIGQAPAIATPKTWVKSKRVAATEKTSAAKPPKEKKEKKVKSEKKKSPSPEIKTKFKVGDKVKWEARGGVKKTGSIVRFAIGSHSGKQLAIILSAGKTTQAALSAIAYA